jgi:hypothetical protein
MTPSCTATNFFFTAIRIRVKEKSMIVHVQCCPRPKSYSILYIKKMVQFLNTVVDNLEGRTVAHEVLFDDVIEVGTISRDCPFNWRQILLQESI